MKKITFLILMLSAFSGFAQFPETFDKELPTSWAVFLGDNGLGATRTWEYSTYEYMLVLWDEDTNGGTAENWLVTPKFNVSSSNSVLTFLLTDLNEGEYGSDISVRVSTKESQTTISDFTTKTTILESDIITASVFQNFSVDLSEYIGSDVYVAFVMTNNNGDAWVLDTVDLVPNATAPNPVITPMPANKAVDISIDATDGSDDDTDPDNRVDFSWLAATTGDAATSYDVYLGDASDALSLLGSTGNLSVGITGMAYSTTYYWKIVAKNVGGEAVGSETWSFTTESNPALSIETNELKNVSIFPNPTKGFINIKSDEKPTKVTIYNLLGKKVTTINKSELKEDVVDISNLSKGIYLMKILIENTTKTIKIIKE
ncbi:T9SS type A sorting domain-containing protein [Polaribacter vadi]|uniref:T9SS-dependent choice-of-anchor J family protein n=1 Tax=Polaribacter TaxID=52959 RepID=UPI001C08C389|nr:MULTISPECIES: choice-of-anchor J domain-containing protein [Polaribacter]MBU3011632.1 T9SS type A sorting domain-containing protein [Polaribacter vadi]MDO6741445.1 choice-of-anchor J domain-containing protein [Polaribacter sp. 1_MG-2023]